MKLSPLFHSFLCLTYFFSSYVCLNGLNIAGPKPTGVSSAFIFRTIANDSETQGVNKESLVKTLEKPENSITFWSDLLEAIQRSAGSSGVYIPLEESLLNQELKSVRENEDVQGSEPFQYHTRYQ
jgi:hypothetical protein